MTEIYLITGFLGAGKTSFLSHILKNSGERVGVLMNEFGKMSIDGITLSRENLTMTELTNGSIFCACLKDKFIEGLRALVAQGLDRIFIESSGLSDPSNMGSILQLISDQGSSAFIYKGGICLIDSLFFMKERAVMVSVDRQIQQCRWLIMNKTDLIDRQTIEAIRSVLLEINPAAFMIESVHGRIELAQLEGLIDGEATALDRETTNREDNRPTTLSLRLTSPVADERIRHFIDAVAPQCHRLKGYYPGEAQWIKIDGVRDRVDYVPVEPPQDREAQLVFIAATGIGFITHLIQMADRHLAGCYKLQM